MKSLVKRFTLVLVVMVSIYFISVLPGSHLYAQEVIELPQGYVSVAYFYQLKKPECFSSPKWRIIKGKPPKGIKVSPSGLLYGTPKKDSEKEFHIKVSDCKGNIKKIIASLKINKYPYWNEGEKFRASIGFEQSGASSASSQQKVFLELYFSGPIPIEGKKLKKGKTFKRCKKFNRWHPQLGRPLTVWGNIKMTSLPQQINEPLVKAPVAFTEMIKSLNINEIARGIEFLLGVDMRLFRMHGRWGKKIYSLNFVAAYGGATPTNPKDSIQKYVLPKDDFETISKLEDKYDVDLTGKEYIAFVSPDRRKFYHQYFLGLRIKGYSKPEPIVRMENGNRIIEDFWTQFPSIFEVSLGRNEFIVSNDSGKDKKNLLVLRVGGFYPLKISKIVTLYLFGTAMLHFNKQPKALAPIILEPATQDTLFPHANFGQVVFSRDDREYYRIGVGIELSEILNMIF